jgi:hypothetical protein
MRISFVTRLALLTCAGLACAGATAGCDDSGGAYDAEKDCQSTQACLRERGQSVQGSLASCIEASNQLYERASESQQAAADSIFEQCQDEEGCAFIECAQEEAGGSSDSGGSSVSVSGLPSGSSSGQAGAGAGARCDESLALSGEVPSSVGPFAYNGVDARFWTNQEGCLTEIDVDFKSAGCKLTFTAKGLTDAEGRYLITGVTLQAQGLCPGYPEGVSGITSESAQGEPLGTIELKRDMVSWASCVPGELIIRPAVALELYIAGMLGATMRIDFAGGELHVAGLFSGTHSDFISDCPVVFQ